MGSSLTSLVRAANAKPSDVLWNCTNLSRVYEATVLPNYFIELSAKLLHLGAVWTPTGGRSLSIRVAGSLL